MFCSLNVWGYAKYKSMYSIKRIFHWLLSSTVLDVLLSLHKVINDVKRWTSKQNLILFYAYDSYRNPVNNFFVFGLIWNIMTASQISVMYCSEMLPPQCRKERQNGSSNSTAKEPLSVKQGKNQRALHMCKNNADQCYANIGYGLHRTPDEEVLRLAPEGGAN